MTFKPELRERLLLWCDRHCCLCKKACGVMIEVHHIEHGGPDTEDNAIPLCFECHALVGHYNDGHPRGIKIGSRELKARREQVYEEFTRRLVPPLRYELRAHPDGPPRVLFDITHPGDAPPIKARVEVSTFVDGVSATDTLDPMYRGVIPWSLNPSTVFNGHFQISPKRPADHADLSVGIAVSVEDVYQRVHRLLAVSYVYLWERPFWYLDPMEVKESMKRRGICS